MLTVANLVANAKDGEDRIYQHTLERTGAEPVFFEPASMGEYPCVPLWANMPSAVQDRPHQGGNGWPGRSFSDFGPLEFQIKRGGPRQLADFKRITGDIFLMRKSLHDLLTSIADMQWETGEATVLDQNSKPVPDYLAVMPIRRLDCVDVAKTDVRVRREAMPKGSDRFITFVYYPNGFVVRDEFAACDEVKELHNNRWLWSQRVVDAVSASKARGLRFRRLDQKNFI